MRYLALILCVLLAAPVAAVELGVGGAYYSGPGEMTPFIGLCTALGGHEAFATWSRQGDTNHTNLHLTLDVHQVEDVVTVYALGGAGFAWEDWDKWEPELVYGIGLRGPVANFTGRAGWQHTETGGAVEGTNSFFLGVYVGGGK